MEESALIKGAESCLWTEYIEEESHGEYMMYPRLLALSEILWNAPVTKDYDEFMGRVYEHYSIYPVKMFTTVFIPKLCSMETGSALFLILAILSILKMFPEFFLAEVIAREATVSCGRILKILMRALYVGIFSSPRICLFLFGICLFSFI